MNIQKRLPAFVLSVLLCFSLCAFPAAAQNGGEIPDLTGGVITELGSTVLDVEETKLYPDEVQAFLADVEASVKAWEHATVTVEKDEKKYVLPMRLDWDYSALENPPLGQSIEICGTIISPGGCTFSDYLPQQLCYYITIIPRPEDVPDLSGGVVTYVNPFLGRFWRQTLEKGEAMAYFAETAKTIADYDEYILIEKDGKTWPVQLQIEWDYTGINDERLGDYSLIGKIMPPAGCTFAADVLTQISLPVRVTDSPERIPLTLWKFATASDRPQNLLIAPGDENALKNWEEAIRSTAVGCASEDGNYIAKLQLAELDLQAVKSDVPGIYPVTAHFELIYDETDAYMDRYEPSDEVLAMPLLVKVSDLQKLELWNTGNGLDLIQLEWIKQTSQTPKALYTASATALSEQALSEVKWELSPWEVTGENSLKISSYKLKENLHYYFRLEDGDESSNIVHILYDGTSIRNDYLDYGGDRDGGGGNDNTLPPVTQPMPTDRPNHEEDKTPGGEENTSSPTTPENKPDSAENITKPDTSKNKPNHNESIVEPVMKPSLPAENTQISPYEEDSDTRSVWSGLRLKYACALKDTVVFVKGDVTLTFSSSVLQEMKLTDTDLFEAQVTRPDKNSADISIKINGQAVSGIHGMQVQISYNPQDVGSDFTVIRGGSSETISAAFENNAIRFTTDKAGLFTIKEAIKSHDTPSQDANIPKHSVLLFILITAAALTGLLAAVFLIWRRRR